MAKEEEKKIKVPTAEKRDIQNEKRRLLNKSFKSKVKTAMRAFTESLKNDDVNLAHEKLNTVFSLVDKGAKKKILKKNKTNRIKSKLSSLFQKRSEKDKTTAST